MAQETVTAIIRYCQYQERCQAEVRQKLSEWSVFGDWREEIIADLITTGLLNETRYAQAYARGKFRLLKWGRIKIAQELKRKQISPLNIKIAMQEINEDDYEQLLNQLAEKKLATLKSTKNKLEQKRKLYNYLIQKGFEKDLVGMIIHLKLDC